MRPPTSPRARTSNRLRGKQHRVIADSCPHDHLDLYAVGLVFYQILTLKHPCAVNRLQALKRKDPETTKPKIDEFNSHFQDEKIPIHKDADWL